MSETVTCASCVNLDKDGWCEKMADSPYPDAERYCGYHQTATKAEIIRRMPEEELARFLCDISSCRNCIAKRGCGVGRNGFLDWLKEEINEQK